MGKPDGGWYDETPPSVMACMPEDGATDVHSQKVIIYFDEFIKLENAQEKVVISPPQLEMPEIKATGKRIIVELKDTLKPNTTYTIDFSDAITDNNEGNPLGNYTYSFSTGGEIDTMEVSGYVVDAQNLEPLKGILVGLYNNLADSAFTHEPMLRVSRTDSRGRFVIKGVAHGQYRAYALQDADGDYVFKQKSEMVAFNHDIIVPSAKPDIRQDTIWRDSLHIEDIIQTGYTHFLPDDIVLRAFTEKQTDRYLIKRERVNPERLNFYFTYGDSIIPELEGLNFDAKDAFLTEHTTKRDTITYWLRDTTLINQDTLHIAARYHVTDTLGQLVWETDTFEMLPKVPYERRMKEKKKELEKWEKRQERAKKKGKTVETELPKSFLDVIITMNDLTPENQATIVFPTPMAVIDTTAMHLYMKEDTLWTDIGLRLEPYMGRNHSNAGDVKRYYTLSPGNNDGQWQLNQEYSLEVDSAAFTDIYGMCNKAFKQSTKLKSEDDFTSITIHLTGVGNAPWVVQLLNGSDKVFKEVTCRQHTAEFMYIKPGIYYLRAFEDTNDNGEWDTGSYDNDLQAETVCYYPDKIECKAKWTVEQDWNPMAIGAERQKPGAITKQKADKEKKVKQRNIERARKMGIEYIPKNLSTQ